MHFFSYILFITEGTKEGQKVDQKEGHLEFHSEVAPQIPTKRLVGFKAVIFLLNCNTLAMSVIPATKIISLYMLVFSSVTWLCSNPFPHQLLLARPAEGFISFKKSFLGWFDISNITLILRRKRTLFHCVNNKRRWTEDHQMRLCCVTQEKKNSKDKPLQFFTIDLAMSVIPATKIISLYMLVFSSVTWLCSNPFPHQLLLARPAEGFISFKKSFLGWFDISNITLILRRKRTLFHCVNNKRRWTEDHQMRLCCVTQEKKNSKDKPLQFFTIDLPSSIKNWIWYHFPKGKAYVQSFKGQDT